MVTPLNDDLSIDIDAVERIVSSFMKNGASPFILGTTGESASILSAQKELLVEKLVSLVNGKCLTYAGISSNCLSESVSFAQKYKDLGIDVVVSTLPAYYPMNDEQMFRYFNELADQVSCPLIIYNMPATTKLSIPVEVIEKLSYHPKIVGIKDSERGMDRLNSSIKLWKDRTDFVHLLGWAAQSANALQLGSDGIVPSTGNLTPKLYTDLYRFVLDGKPDLAVQLQEKADQISLLYQKNRGLNESIPALKVMMSVIGLCKPNVLAPMYRVESTEERKYIDFVKEELQKHKIDSL